MIYISELSKTFSGQKVLNNLSLEIQKGEVVALIGSSGAGKSTFLRSLNYLEAPDSGRIKIDDFEVDFEHITQDQILTLRRKLAMVFQQFNLFGRKTALENVKEGLVVVKGLSDQEATKIAREELAKVGLSDRENHYPRHLSGGQKQRVAVARAIITSPEILLADEPTGALDSKSSAALLDVFEDINTMGQTILMVTHSTAAAARAKRVLFIKDGILYNQIFRGEKTERQMFQEISDTLTVMASEVE